KRFGQEAHREAPSFSQRQRQPEGENSRRNSIRNAFGLGERKGISYALQMAKVKSRYVCQACGSVSSRWQGQCADCAEWNTLVQESAEVSSIFAAKHNLHGGGRVIPLVGLETPAALPERLPSGLAEFDRAIGGGIVAGSAMLVGGDPGIGKSTLLLQVAARLASEGHKIIYVSGE